jgi:serine/threonine protein kinase
MPEPLASFYCLECEMLVGPLDKCPVCELQTLNTGDLPQKAKPPPDSELLGQEFGGCQVQQVLSRRSVWITAQGVQTALNRPALVKLYPLSKLLLPHIRRTVHAARKVASLSHPSIAQVYKVGVRDLFLFIVLQHFRGPTLRDRLSGSPPSPQEAEALFKQIAEGMRLAHNEGLIHGDLKPENIHLDDRGTPKISDFGTPTGTVEFSEPEETVDCQFYWSPERWLAKDIDARADLYSLGVIFYEMLCGSRPFEVREPQKLMFAHVNLPPAPPAQVRPAVPRELSAVAMKLLEKDPEQRYATVKDLLDDLQRYESRAAVRATQEAVRTVRCKLCDTENPAGEIYCHVCQEPIAGKRPTIRIADNPDEFQCNICQRYVPRGSAACPNCMNAVCPRCGSGVSAGSNGLCPACVKASPPSDAGLLKKMTEFFRKKK